MSIKAYVRCSTDETKQDLQRQVREIQLAAGEGVHVDFYSEYEHGTADSKKEQKKLFADVQPGDTIIVTEVSRLTRSMRQLCEIIEKVEKRQLRLQIVNSITIDCRNGKMDAMSRAFLQMAGVFSELEREMLSDRVKSGVQKAIADGKRVGRPVLTYDSIPDKFFKYFPMFTSKQMKKIDFAKMLGVSRPTLDKYIKFVLRKE